MGPIRTSQSAQKRVFPMRGSFQMKQIHKRSQHRQHRQCQCRLRANMNAESVLSPSEWNASFVHIVSELTLSIRTNVQSASSSSEETPFLFDIKMLINARSNAIFV